MTISQANNIFKNIPSDLSQEVFEKMIDTDALSIERIISNGQRAPETGWFDQAESEWLILLQGQAQIEIECSGVRDLNVGDYLNIPSHQRHRVLSTAKETIWLAIHYS